MCRVFSNKEATDQCPSLTSGQWTSGPRRDEVWENNNGSSEKVRCCKTKAENLIATERRPMVKDDPELKHRVSESKGPPDVLSPVIDCEGRLPGSFIESSHCCLLPKETPVYSQCTTGTRRLGPATFEYRQLGTATSQSWYKMGKRRLDLSNIE